MRHRERIAPRLKKVACPSLTIAGPGRLLGSLSRVKQGRFWGRAGDAAILRGGRPSTLGFQLPTYRFGHTHANWHA